MKIDLRKDKRKLFYINKNKLIPFSRASQHLIINIISVLKNDQEYYNKYYERRIDDDIRRMLLNIKNNVIKITREEYKVFRNMDDDTKRLFIELKED